MSASDLNAPSDHISDSEIFSRMRFKVFLDEDILLQVTGGLINYIVLGDAPKIEYTASECVKLKSTCDR